MKTCFLIPCILLSMTAHFCSPVHAGEAEDKRRVQDIQTSRTLRVELNKSVIFRLDEDATRVSVANTQIADVTLITPKQILVVSKQNVGVTNLIVWYGDDNASAYDVEVYIPSHLLKTVHEALKKLAPRANVTPTLTNRSLVLDGFVEDQESLVRVLKIAESFVPEITNLIRVRGAIQKAIENALPEKSEADLTVTMTAEGIVLAGTVDSQETLLQVLQAARTFTPNVTNMVRVKGAQQVQLEVTIAEVSRSAMKQMGLNYLTNSDGGRIGLFNTGTIGNATTTDANTASSSDGDVNVDEDASSSGSDSSLAETARDMWTGRVQDVFDASTISSTYGAAFQVLAQSMSKDRLAIISLLKGQGLARTLATPTLVTLNGQEAEFLVGGEIPYVTDEAIVFRNFGIQLKFTPYVTGTETITLKVEPEVSTPDLSFNPPGLKRRSGSTTLQLKDGQTFVMAGLLTEELSRIKNKIPLLGDLPILGTLFTSKQFRKSESELVIVVTPRLVQPLNPGTVPPLPGDELDNDTNDARFFFFNDKTLPAAKRVEGDDDAPARYGATGFAQ